MKEELSRVLDWCKGKKAGPLSIEIWPTNRCNLQCIMCGTRANQRILEKKGIDFNLGEEKMGEISEEKLLSIVKEGNELGVKNWLLSGGGEPCIRKETTLKLMSEIKKRNMNGNINTNGTLLSKDNVIKIIKMNWDMVMFSLDSADAKVHDFIRGVNGAFKKSVENLQNFKELKKKLKSDKPQIVFNTVLHNKNYRNLDKIIKLASSVGCNDITFQPLIKFDKFEVNIALGDGQKEEFQRSIYKIKKLAETYNVNTNINSLARSEIKKDETNPLSFCFEPFLHLVIKSRGEVTPCCMIESFKENIKEKTLGEIWLGKYFTELRKRFLEGNLLEDCKKCVFSQAVRNKELQEQLRNYL